MAKDIFGKKNKKKGSTKIFFPRLSNEDIEHQRDLMNEIERRYNSGDTNGAAKLLLALENNEYEDTYDNDSDCSVSLDDTYSNIIREDDINTVVYTDEDDDEDLTFEELKKQHLKLADMYNDAIDDYNTTAEQYNQATAYINKLIKTIEDKDKIIEELKRAVEKLIKDKKSANQSSINNESIDTKVVLKDPVIVKDTVDNITDTNKSNINTISGVDKVIEDFTVEEIDDEDDIDLDTPFKPFRKG